MGETGTTVKIKDIKELLERRKAVLILKEDKSIEKWDVCFFDGYATALMEISLALNETIPLVEIAKLQGEIQNARDWAKTLGYGLIG